MIESFLRIVWRQRLITLLFGAILAVIAAIALPRLSLNDSPEQWMPASAVDDWYRFGEHFSYGDGVAIAVHFQKPIVDTDADCLKDIRQDIEKIPGVLRVIDPSTIFDGVEQQISFTELMKTPTDPYNDRFASYRGVLIDSPEKWRPALLAEQEKNGVAINDGSEATGRTVIVYVECKEIIVTNADDKKKLDDQRREIVHKIQEILHKKEQQRNDVVFHVLGAIVVQSELENIAKKMLWKFIPLSLLLTFLALGISFRSVKSVLIAVLGALWSTLILCGGIAWVGWSLNVVTIDGPIVMFVIVIATTVHFAHHASEKHDDEIGEEERAFNEASGLKKEESHFIRWVAFPCLGAAITTGIGFLMLSFNELTPTRELGIELFFGSALAFGGAFLVWLMLHPFRAAAGKYLSFKNFDRFHQWVSRRPVWAVAITGLLAVGLGISATRISVDADPFSFFHPKSKMAASFQHVTQRQFGLYRLDILLVPKTTETDQDGRKILRKEDRQAAWDFQQKIMNRPEYRSGISSLELQNKIAQLEKKTDGISFFRKAGIKKTFRSWLHDEKNSGAIRITLKVDDLGEGFQPLLKTVDDEFPHDRFDSIVTGTAYSAVILSDGLLGGIKRGLIAALLAMACLCFLWFRSFRLTAIAFVPNAFPILTVFGFMGLFGIPLNCGSAMVMTISLGIALNDTVHFIVHYMQHKKQGANTDDAVAATVREIGRPIVLTSIVNCLGFAIFTLSEFRPMSHFGSLTSVAMLAALIGDLILLPNLLKLFADDSEKK